MIPSYKPFVKELCRLVFWFPLRWSITIIPRCFLMHLAHCAGMVLYHGARQRRLILAHEFKACFPSLADPEVTVLVKKTIIGFVKDQIEVLTFPHLTVSSINAISDVTGIENLRAAIGKNKGVILLLSHFGCEQLVMAILGFRGIPLYQASLPADSVSKVHGGKDISTLHLKTMEIKRSLEESLPVTIVYPHKGIWELISTLKNGKILSIAADGRFSERFNCVNFLGRQARFSPGPFKIGLRYGSPLIPVFVNRRDNDHFHLMIEEPLQHQIKLSGDRHMDTTKVLEAYVQRLEFHITRSPDHYGMFLYQAYTHTRDKSNALFI